MHNYSSLATIILLAFLIQSCKHEHVPHEYKITKTVVDDSAMVVSAHPVATKIGIEVLRDGGNAIDAAIAVQYALAVCYPIAGNIGGGGFMIYRPADGDAITLDFREKAPNAAFADMYLDANGNADSKKSRFGALAAGVPGTVDGMEQAYKRYSKLKDWDRLIQPSIDIAQNGFFLTERQAKILNAKRKDFDAHNTGPTPFNDRVYEKGDLLVQKDLAKTLMAIKENNRAGFYEGWVADKIVDQMKASNGIISHQDLKEYKAKWRKPIIGQYRGYEIISMPPPSSGGIALIQILKMLEPYDISSMGHHSVATTHLMAEAERRVYADRATHLGDSDFYNVPVSMLLDSNYIQSRMDDFDPRRASKSEDIKAGMAKESMQTTHFTVVDHEGNAVSLTTTINGAYGAKTVVQGAGFLLNNEMDDFSAKPGVPNMFGLIGAEANKIEPGKRMLSSMTPTIVAKDGKLVLTAGSPGGSTIITSVMQTISNVIDFGMTASEAVAAPRFHHQWLPDKIRFEETGFDVTLVDSLKAMGHDVIQSGKLGKVEAIYMTPKGMIEGAADIRADDAAMGF